MNDEGVEKDLISDSVHNSHLKLELKIDLNRVRFSRKLMLSMGVNPEIVARSLQSTDVFEPTRCC